MGSNTLYTVADPAVAADADLNQYFTALTGDVLPRNNPSGAVQDVTHSLGSLTAQWKNVYGQNIFINGTLFDPTNVGTGTDSANAIVSGKVRTDSGQPDFLRASGAGASMTIQATATPLKITANGTSVTISADIAVSSLTVAPAANNTCLVNDAALAGAASTKYTGEHESDPLTIDTVGTEISNRIGQYVCLKTSTEYMLAFVESATTLRHVYRGFFFDSAGNPLVRVALSDNNTLTLMSLGWIFMDSNGSTVDVSYTSPKYAATAPAAPVLDDYWFDLTTRKWKRYDGSVYQIVNRTLIGLVVIDATNAIATRSFDFTKSFLDLIEMEVEVKSVTVARAKSGRNVISVYAQTNEFYAAPLEWDIAQHLESGLTEAVSTLYYLYITEKGAPKICVERPYDRLPDLKGFYHPYHSWRYVGVIYNDASSNITKANSLNSGKGRVDVFKATGEWLALPNRGVKFTLTGGGGGGGGVGAGKGAGGGGGTTSIGSLISATGGTGGVVGAPTTTGSNGGGGGGGTNALNMSGGDGGNGFTDQAGWGGDSHFSGITRAGYGAGLAGVSGGNYGGGGSGAANSSTPEYGGGGGGGGTGIEEFHHLSGRHAVTIGAAGAAGAGTFAGGAGIIGIAMVEYL